MKQLILLASAAFLFVASCAAEDSTSILALLTGEKTSLPDHPLVVHHDIRGTFAIRSEKWKLVDNLKLFDLDNDIKETTNVAEEHPEVVKALSATLKHYRVSGRSRR